MRSEFFRHARLCVAGITLALMASTAHAEPAHGIAMYGDPALPPDFVSLPYANPDAPKGGEVVTGNVGTFDTLNPFTLKGEAPWQLRFLTHESLMGRSYDEPFTLYGLLAESVETGPNREWVEFTLREDARFSDGTPVTVEDVIWSYKTIGEEGHPRYRSFWSQVGEIEATGPRSVRLTFTTEDRELALLAGLRPILKKSQWDDLDFAAARLEDVPIGSGPYIVDSYEIGRHVTLRRNPDYWGADVPFRRGTSNFDEIRIEYYGDNTVLQEAFKAQALSYMREFNAERWATQYTFPAVERGEILLAEIPHAKPSGITGFVFNTRRAPLDDWRVRDALIHAFNFEYMNDTLTGGRQPRITSYFSRSELGMQEGPAQGRVLELLSRFENEIPREAITGYALPQGDGTARNRRNLGAAMALLQEAGWTVQDGVLKNEAGQPFRFEILLTQGATENQSIIDIYVPALQRLGIQPQVTTVDSAQYNLRINDFDYDMTYMRRQLSLSPGNEQRLYWGSEAAGQTGSRNLIGIASPAVDAMIEEMLNARSHEDFVAATRALDRLLTTGRYAIPIFAFDVGRIAHSAHLHHPDSLPIYGDSFYFMPEVWWSDQK